MGLDIYAYSGLKKVDVTSDENLDDYLEVWENPAFPGRAAGLEDGKFYTYEKCQHVFRRSYSGYNTWRETLAKMAGYPFSETEQCYAGAAWSGEIPEDSAFFELINFSDCEGTIGPIVAKKLLKDFIDFKDRAKDMDEYFYKGYLGILNGLEIASNNGALRFG